MSMERKVTPYFSTGHLVADVFNREIGYDNWRPGGTEDWLLIYTVSGVGYVGSGEYHTTVTAGSVVLYSPSTPQEYGTFSDTGSWHILWAHFQPRESWRLWMQWPEQAPGLTILQLQDLHIRESVEQALMDCIHSSRHFLPNHQELAMNSLERAILWVDAACAPRKLDARIRKAIHILAHRLTQPFSLDQIARDCGLSPSHFLTLFREQLRITPRQYLENMRMERAALLLRNTNLSVTEIAEQTGFSEPFYFTNRFRKKFHQSPSMFRKASSD
jgi:AraC family transcriptional regulator of arabinose operon